MEDIAPYLGPALIAKRVDPAEIAQHRPFAVAQDADMVHMIQLDDIPVRMCRAVPPCPADRDPGVLEIVDVVVDEAVERALADPHADGTVEDRPRYGYDYRGAGSAGQQCTIVLQCLEAKEDAPGAEIGDLGPLNEVVLARGTERDAIGADMHDGAVLERDLPHPGACYCRRHACGRLIEAAGIRIARIGRVSLREEPFRVAERDPAE